MKNKDGLKLASVVLMRLFLGIMMIQGGVKKFEKPIPSSVEVVEKAQKFTSPNHDLTLKKILYINGMKQTGYFWQVLGIFELFLGLLLIFQKPSFLAAVLLLPITFQILLFHAFLELDDLGELALTSVLFLINVFLVMKEYPTWKKLAWIRI